MIVTSLNGGRSEMTYDRLMSLVFAVLLVIMCSMMWIYVTLNIVVGCESWEQKECITLSEFVRLSW